MYYIVGLGNPGEKYAETRHNIGWIVLEHFLEVTQLPSPVESAAYSGRISEGVVAGEDVTVLFPDTFMNNSGSAVKKLLPKGSEQQLIVLYDDIDIPLGDLKISVGRGSGGHNGVQSIITQLGTKDFVRVRLGIAQRSRWPWEKQEIRRPAGGGALERYVLGRFGRSEQKALQDVKEHASKAVKTIITDGVETAMNRFN